MGSLVRVCVSHTLQSLTECILPMSLLVCPCVQFGLGMAGFHMSKDIISYHVAHVNFFVFNISISFFTFLTLS